MCAYTYIKALVIDTLYICKVKAHTVMLYQYTHRHI